MYTGIKAHTAVSEKKKLLCFLNGRVVEAEEKDNENMVGEAQEEDTESSE